MKKILIYLILINSTVFAGVCDEVLSPNSPTTAVNPADISFNITDYGLNQPKILNSVTISGNSFETIIPADMVNYNHSYLVNRNFIMENGSITNQSTEGSIFLAKLRDISNNYNLNNFLAIEDSPNGNYVEYIYSNPVLSSGDRYLFTTRRDEGRNSYQGNYIQALNSVGNLTGTQYLLDGPAYFDSGTNIEMSGGTRDNYIGVLPLTALVPTGTPIYGIRVTKFTDFSGSGEEDGIDGKVFLYLNSSTIPCKIVANDDNFNDLEADDYTSSIFLDNGNDVDYADEAVAATDANIHNNISIITLDGLDASTTISSDGLIHIPSITQSGIYRPIYKICLEKDLNYCDTAIATIEINNKPQENNDTAVTDQGLTIDIDVLANDTHIDTGEVLSLSGVDSASNGSTSIVGGKIRYTPNPGFYGLDTFNYFVRDSKGNIKRATVEVTVNSAPNITINDSTITEGGMLSFVFQLSSAYGSDMELTLGINDVSSDNTDYNSSTPLTLTIPANALKGTFRINTIDDMFDENTEEFNLTILSSNTEVGDISDVGVGYILDNDDSPVAEDDNLTVNQGIHKDVYAIGNDYHPMLEDFTIVDFIPPTNGTVSFQDEGDTDPSNDYFIYTPNPGFVGTDSFTYKIEDDYGNEDNGTVFLNVIAAPDLTISDANTTEGGNLNFEISTSHTVSEDMNISLLITNNSTTSSDWTAVPMNVLIVRGTFSSTFTVPTVDDTLDEANTEDLTLSITFVDKEIGDTSDTGLGTIFDNDASPIAVDDNTNTQQGISVNIPVLNNDSHPTSGEVLSIKSSSNGSHGTTLIDDKGTPETNDDEVVYTPNFSFVGVDTFTYIAEDLQGNKDTATVTVNVSQAPDVTISDATITEGGNLNFTFELEHTYPDNIVLNLGITNNTTDNSDHNGLSSPLEVTILANQLTGIFTLETVDDGIDEANSEDLTLSIISSSTPVGDTSDIGTGYILDNDSSPVANDDDIETDQGLSVVAQVLSNDIHPEIGETIEVVSVSGATNGSVVIDDKGTAGTADDEVIYTPDAGYVGSDSFIYTIEDSDGNQDTATVNVNIYSAPDVIINDASITEGGNLLFNINLSKSYGAEMTITFNYINNTTDDNDHMASTIPLQTVIEKNRLVGTLVIPTIDDGVDEDSSENLTISINSVSTEIGDISDSGTGTILDNDNSPNAVDDNITVDQGLETNLNVLLNDSHPTSGEVLEIISVSSPSNGSAVIDTKGTSNKEDDEITYTPNSGYVGLDSFTYTIRDLQGNEDTATINIMVDSAPDVFIADSTKPEGGELSFDITVNKPYGSDIKFELAVTNITTTDDDHQANSTLLEVVLPKGKLLTKFSLGTIDDNLDENNSESLELSILSASTDIGDINDIGTGYILDNETPSQAIDDNITGTPFERVDINILENDIEGSQTLDRTTIRLIDNGTETTRIDMPNVGVWEVNLNTGILSFTPVEYYMRDLPELTYIVKDSGGNETSANINLNYNPLALDDMIVLNDNESKTIDFLNNDKTSATPIDMDSIFLINGNNEKVKELQVSKGLLKITSEGKLEFTAGASSNAEFGKLTDSNGLIEVDYIFSEENGETSNIGTISIYIVSLKNDYFSSENISGNEETINIIANDDKRVDRDTLSLVGATSSNDVILVQGQGIWNLNKEDGSVIFIPEEGFYENPSPIQYTASYNGVNLNPATITLVYKDELPYAQDNLGIPITVLGETIIDVLNNDSFGASGAGDKTFTYTIPSHGLVSIDDNGTPLDASDDKLIYQANNVDFVGTDSFSYTITDKRGRTATAKVTLNIACSASQHEDSAYINKIVFLLLFGLLLFRRKTI